MHIVWTEKTKQGIAKQYETKTDRIPDESIQTGQRQGLRQSVIVDNRGVGVVEIILILVILIGLVVIFKNQITAIVEEVFESITSGVSDVVA